eukprot:TRINITY_DN2486_c0_g1_i1.p1 TRINITY_DN2486_c0_g1~~TRINITY_DN2486_c0_g1_i1.p1  ORF type:complete len:177 (-),score=53.20 TRINITY_DN2486_c0_g1_i1:676-1206(-)
MDEGDEGDLHSGSEESKDAMDLTNYGEIDASGRPLRHPSVDRLDDVVSGLKRLTLELSDAVGELVDLCEGRYKDIQTGRSIFPLPVFGDPSHLYDRLSIGVYIGLVDLLRSEKRPGSMSIRRKIRIYLFRGSDDAGNVVRICISADRKLVQDELIPCVCIVSKRNLQSQNAGFSKR